MNKFFIALAAILIASPVVAHPRKPRTNWSYSYPEKGVMVRRDWKRCKKIKYVTKYDKWGWYTERKVLPLKSCWAHQHHHGDNNTKIKVIIK
tara:strand:- start:2943 stop:3218 length:276 start_codon:yes stop_codon:yes gene_type:complete